METTANTTVDTAATTAVEAPAEILLDSVLSVLEDPMSLATAIKSMDSDGWLTAVVPVGLWSLIDSRIEENEESGEDYAIVSAMVAESVIPVQMSYEVVGVRPDNVLLLKATFELKEALATCYDEEELAELEAQGA
ncbi:hypothetical protein [Kocuria rhizosphaericola]|uniref:hypothetical protein n=1 Tax=Kocuria rhizosphaericola TaxID=3376284 RepID=UPI00378F9A77